MVHRIFKYKFDETFRQEIKLPKGAHVLDYQIQHENLCLWAIVDDEETQFDKKVYYIFGTGQEIDRGYLHALAHRATVQALGGQFIWHIFEQIGEPTNKLESYSSADTLAVNKDSQQPELREQKDKKGGK